MERERDTHTHRQRALIDFSIFLILKNRLEIQNSCYETAGKRLENLRRKSLKHLELRA